MQGERGCAGRRGGVRGGGGGWRHLRAKMLREDGNLDATAPVVGLLDPLGVLGRRAVERRLVILDRVGEHALGHDGAQAVGALAAARAALKGVSEGGK